MPNGHRIVLLPDARLSLTTLGRATLVSVEADGTATERFGPGKPLALLAYVAFSPRRTATREHLIDLLWADTDPERAAHALRQLVWQIRHTLGEKALVTHNGDLRLGLSIDSDRDAFLAAVEAGALEEAVERYSGDFLPALALPGGAEFEQWADIERIRLRTAFLRTGEALVRRQLAEGHVRDAQRLARRVRDADLLNESGWRLMLEALGAGNDYVAAAMEADTLEHLLRAEEREPEPATKAALRTARQVPPETDASQQALVAELVGREREFAAIVGAWEVSRRGPARHVHITAPAGLGKTRLMQDVLARLRAGGARAVYVRANPGERHIASAFAGDVAAAVARLPGATGVTPTIASTLVALNPALSSVYSAMPERRGGEDALRSRGIALAELFQAVAEEAPLCLLLDDLHWADPQSRQVLNGALGRIGSGKILIVSAARPSADPVTAAEGMTQLRLEPLSDSQTAALLSSLAQLPDEEWARSMPRRLHASTGGSPLLILESLQLAIERVTLQFKGHEWHCPDPMRLTAELAQGAALRHRIEQQDRTSQWILVTLAVAGTPLSATLLARLAARPEDAIVPLLTALEERGLVARVASEWEPAHDEIAALALETATSDALSAAHSGLGKALATVAERDTSQIPHAARHLAAGGDEAMLANLTARWMRERRRRGDRRGNSDLVNELLGEGGSAERVARLTTHLPLSLRLGLDSPGRIAIAAGAALALIGAAGVALSRPARRPIDAAMVVVTPDGRVRRIELHEGDWQSIDRVDVDRSGVDYSVVSAKDIGRSATPSPDGSAWALSQEYADSGEVDLTLVLANGSRVRLTDTRGDDGGPAYSPDGRQLVFSTGRWDPLSHVDLAILDPATGHTRQLTTGSASDVSARWSPDGARIAFVRGYFDRRGPNVCWITPDGSTTTCFKPRQVVPLTIEGWSDPLHIIVVSTGDTTAILARIDLQSRQTTMLEQGVLRARVSPDGRWIACLSTGSHASLGWWIFPANHPEDAKPIIYHGAPATDVDLQWAAAEVPPRYLNRLNIEAAHHVPINAPTQLRAVGLDSRGNQVPLPLLRWWSADTSVAAINSTGIVSPHHIGSVKAFASAGGWREDSAVIVIDPPTSTVVLRDSWSDGITPNFIPYGWPRPQVVMSTDSVPSFLNGGDGSYNSGAFSRRTFDASRGLGIAARFSAPTTLTQWQYVTVGLQSNIDTVAFASWMDRTGSLPTTGHARFGCSFAYPAGEGEAKRNAITVSWDGTNADLPTDPALSNGTWHTAQLQIFPDGRCGFALDDKPLVVLDNGGPIDRRYWVNLDGKSFKTRMLLGPVEVWEGIKDGIDWSSAPVHH